MTDNGARIPFRGRLLLATTPLVATILVLIAMNLWREQWSIQPLAATYLAELASGEDVGIALSARFSGGITFPLKARFLLADRLINAESIEAASGADVPLSVSSTTAYIQSGNALSAYTTYSIDCENKSDRYEAAGKEVRVRYRITPSVRKVTSPCGEPRHEGYLGATSSTVAAANILLLPIAVLEGVEVGFPRVDPDKLYPSGTTTITSATEEDLWALSWSIGEFEALNFADSPRVNLLGHSNLPPEAAGAVSKVLSKLVKLLGPPREDVRVRVVPRAEDGLRINVPSISGEIVIDMGVADRGTIRRLIREIVPAWYGRSRSEVERSTEYSDWFMLCLGDYLAYALGNPYADSADVDCRNIEYTWVTSSHFNHEPEAKGVSDLVKLPARRIRGTSFLHQLVLDMGGLESLRELLHEWNGCGYPTPRAGEVAAAMSSAVKGYARDNSFLRFTSSWKLDKLNQAKIVRVTGKQDDRSEDDNFKTLHIVYTASTEGLLENCGCKISQDGGVARRAAAIKTLREKLGAPLVLDVGGFMPYVKHTPLLPEIVLEEQKTFSKAVGMMKYDAFVLGSKDLAYGLDPLLECAAELTAPVLGSGISARETGEPLYPRSLITSIDGLKVGLVSVCEHLEKAWLRESHDLNAHDFVVDSSLEAAMREIELCKREADVVIVAGQISPASIAKLSEIDGGIVLISSLDPQTTLKYQDVGSLGESVVAYDHMSQYGINVLTVKCRDEDGAILGASYEGISLPRSAPVAEEVQALLDAFYESAANKGIGISAEGLALFDWDDAALGQYIGSASCKICHIEQYRQWEGTAHAGAYETLVSVRRNRQAKCVVCHVVGVGREGGYDLDHPTPDVNLAGVGCEMCHGSGGGHLGSSGGAGIRKVPLKKTCLECHNNDHSEAFPQRFDAAWASVKH